MNYDADLGDALSFIVKRIEEEATRSGKPLTEEEASLLKNLPSAPVIPSTAFTDPEMPSLPVPRDLGYERLIALAKQAWRHDIQLDSKSDRKWRCAAILCELNRHPMSWLLRWSGITRKPWQDRLLLIISASLLVFYFLGMILLCIVKAWTRLGWIIAALGYIVVALLLYFGARHIEERRLRRELENYRITSQE